MELQIKDASIQTVEEKTVSFVNNYMVKQEEIKIHNPVLKIEKKIEIALETFDKYLPLLGILKPIFELIRKDLFDGIYSNSKTSSDYNMKQVPYFVKCHRLSTSRDEVADDLREQIMQIQSIVVVKEKNIKSFEDEILKLNGQILTLTKDLMKQKQIIKEEILESKRLNENIMQLKNEIIQASKDKESLKEIANIEQNYLERMIEGLKSYKHDYDKLDVEFQNKLPAERKIKQVKAPTHISLSENETKQVELLQNIESINELKNQLFTLRNRIVTEYECHLKERKKKFLHVHKRRPIFSDDNWQDKDQESVQETKALMIVKKNFHKSIQEVQKEVALLNEQKAFIEHQIGELKKANVKVKASATLPTDQKPEDDFRYDTKITKNDVNQQHDDLVKIMEGDIENPFIPHQTVFNKFSIMIFTSSNDGKHYTEIPGCTFCPSCHEKTIVCIHKVSDEEKVISLPTKCTNIKITRPKLKIHAKLIEKQKQQHIETNENLEFNEKVWPWFHSMFPEGPNIVRSLTQEELLGFIHEFYACLIWDDELQSIDDPPPDFLHSIVNFLKERYNEEGVVGLVMFDILSHTEKYSKQSKEIELFGKNCSALIDSSSYRYILLIADVINCQRFDKVDEMEILLKAIYPFSTDEEVETLKMNFISFSENRINEHLLFQYILWLLLTGKEPRILEITTSLHSQTVRTTGYISDIELSEAIDSMTPLYSERLRKRLLSGAMGANNTVTTHTAACICAYLVMRNLSRKLINDMTATRDIQPIQLDKNQSEKLVGYSFLNSFSKELQRRKIETRTFVEP